MGRPTKSVAVKWIREHATYQGDDCLKWPFATDARSGYGSLGFSGKTYKAHRFMCELVNGPPPTPKHNAAHSCGKGHEGCVNPRHLSWKTPSENSLDMAAHGTAAKAGRIRNKLTWEDVAEIRFLKDNMNQGEIAEMYGLTFQNVGHIIRGETWRSKPSTFGRTFSEERRAEMKARALAMRAELRSFDEIAVELGVGRGTIRKLVLQSAQ